MAHWAQIDEDNVVIAVTVGDNDDPNGDEGHQWLVDNIGGTWLQCSYNTVGGVHKFGGIPFRKNYPGPGFVYDEDLDAFIPPKPTPNATLNEETFLWDIPIEDLQSASTTPLS
jgi:hypothetical protein